MIEAKCIGKLRDNNNVIVEYVLIDSNGNKKQVSASQLKSAMRAGKINVSNLKITSDNRIITKYANITKDKTSAMIEKAKILGGKPIPIPGGKDGEGCVLLSISETNHILYIPNEIKKLNIMKYDTDFQDTPFTNLLKTLSGKLKLVGGSGLIDTYALFCDCHFDYVDLSNFDTSNVRDMSYMFYLAEINKINFCNIKTNKVTRMDGMFCGFKTNALDLSNFDTKNVVTMKTMFSFTRINKIDISSFNTESVRDAEMLFNGSNVKQIKFSDSMFRHVLTMDSMFCDVKMDELDISSFNLSSVQTMIYMFANAQIKKLTLTKSKAPNLKNVKGMFRLTQIENLNIDNLDLSSVTKMDEMFALATVGNVDLSTVISKDVESTKQMFTFSNIPVIDLRSFSVKKLEDTYCMFHNCRADIVDISSFKENTRLNISDYGFTNSKIQLLIKEAIVDYDC